MRETVLANATPPGGRRLAVVVAVCLLAAGCGPPDPRATAKGTVTLDGWPRGR